MGAISAVCVVATLALFIAEAKPVWGQTDTACRERTVARTYVRAATHLYIEKNLSHGNNDRTRWLDLEPEPGAAPRDKITMPVICRNCDSVKPGAKVSVCATTPFSFEKNLYPHPVVLFEATPLQMAQPEGRH